MKNSIQFKNYYFYGILFMAIIHLLIYCKKENDEPIDNTDQDVAAKIDTKAIENTGGTIENLILNSNQNALNEMMFENTRPSSGASENYSTDELKIIGEAFKNRKVTYATANFAEYTYTIDNVSYTLTVGKDEDGNWKIIRF